MHVSDHAVYDDGTVRVRGTVYPGGLSTTYYFQWGPSAACPATGTVRVTAAGFEPVDVALELPRLDPGAAYHYRLVASNELGSAVSADHSFTTAPTHPEVSTGPARRLDATAATLTGLVDPRGAVIVWSFEVGLTEAYGMETPGGLLSQRHGPVEVSEPLWGLEPGRTYHCRLAVRRGNEVYRGEDRVFLTPPARSLAARLRADRQHRARWAAPESVGSGRVATPAPAPR